MLILTDREKRILSKASKIVLARRSFWHYCKVIDPEFYRDDRLHLVKLCTVLNNFFFGLPLDPSGKVYKNLMINIPPRFGKTRTLVHWTDWALGKDNSHRILTWSYNDDTAGDFSKYARDGITMEKIDPDDIVFSDVFPNTKVKQGSASAYKWALEGQHFNYLGSGVQGSVTSKGGTIQLVDDPIKGAIEALNENHCEDVWQRYTSTFLSRIEPRVQDTLKVMCMTRWSKGDPCGRLLQIEPEKWYVLKMEAMDKTTGEMLCPEFLSKDKYNDIKGPMMPEIFAANYHQEPIDIIGKLYPSLKKYTDLPEDNNHKSLIAPVYAYIDTADEGDDWLCCVIYGFYQGRAYVLDVYYTKAGMEITEPETAKRLMDFNVNLCKIESNSGGRGFARNVQRILWDEYKRRDIIIKWFHQSQNKQGRIISQSNNVMENIFFPVDAATRWPAFWEHINAFQKEGKSKNDDAEDALTGVAENMGPKTVKFLK